MEKQSNLWALILKIDIDSQSTNDLYYCKNIKYLLGFSCSDINVDINEQNGWYEEHIAPFLSKLNLANLTQALNLTEYSYMNTFANSNETDPKYINEITGQIESNGMLINCTIEVHYIPDIISLNLYTRQPKVITEARLIKSEGFKSCSLITSNSISKEDCYNALFPINTIELKSDDELITKICSDTSSDIHHMGEIVKYSAEKYMDNIWANASSYIDNKLIFINLIQNNVQYLIGVLDNIDKLIQDSQDKSDIYDVTDPNPPMLIIDEILLTNKIKITGNTNLLEIKADPVKPYLIELHISINTNKCAYLTSIHLMPDTGYGLNKFNEVTKLDYKLGKVSYVVTVFFDSNIKQFIRNNKLKELKNYLTKTAIEKIFHQDIDIQKDYGNFYVLVVKKNSEILTATTISKIVDKDAPYLYTIPEFNDGYYVYKAYNKYLKDSYYAISLYQDYIIYIFNEVMLSNLCITIKFIPDSFIKDKYLLTLSNILKPDVIIFRTGSNEFGKTSSEKEIQFNIDNKPKMDNLIYNFANRTPLTEKFIDSIKNFASSKEEDGVVQIPC